MSDFAHDSRTIYTPPQSPRTCRLRDLHSVRSALHPQMEKDQSQDLSGIMTILSLAHRLAENASSTLQISQRQKMATYCLLLFLVVATSTCLNYNFHSYFPHSPLYPDQDPSSIPSSTTEVGTSSIELECYVDPNFSNSRTTTVTCRISSTPLPEIVTPISKMKMTATSPTTPEPMVSSPECTECKSDQPVRISPSPSTCNLSPVGSCL